MAASSSDKPIARTVTKQTSLFDKDAFSRISEVQEAADRAWNSSTTSSFMSKGKFGRSALYSESSTTRTAYRTTKITSVTSNSSFTKTTTQSVQTFSSKRNITHTSTAKTSATSSTNAKLKEDPDKQRHEMEKQIEKRFELPSSSHHHIDASEFFKAKFPHDMDSDDFFRSASSRFTMRNLKSSPGWNVEFDDGGSLFPDFFPKNDAATKLSFEATWRAVSPTKEMGLAKQAIRNCSWEDEDQEKKAENQNNAKEIVNSWMQFFGHVNSAKDG